MEGKMGVKPQSCMHLCLQIYGTNAKEMKTTLQVMEAPWKILREGCDGTEVLTRAEHSDTGVMGWEK